MLILDYVSQVPRPTSTMSASSSGTISSLSSATTQISGPTNARSQPSESGGLQIGDKIALAIGIGLGLPVDVATMIGTWFTWRMYLKKSGKNERSMALGFGLKSSTRATRASRGYG